MKKNKQKKAYTYRSAIKEHSLSILAYNNTDLYRYFKQSFMDTNYKMRLKIYSAIECKDTMIRVDMKHDSSLA